MSKSQDNTIPMLAEPEELWATVRTAVTDPARVRRTDPGNPDICNVYSLHAFFTDPAEREEIGARCREKARDLREHPARVNEILADGAARARVIARATLEEAYDRMGLESPADE